MPQNTVNNRKAFTLVELLIAVMIICLLTVLLTAASQSAVRSSKESKTRATIMKLDTAIRQIYEGYGDQFENIPHGVQLDAQNEAQRKLNEIYGLMQSDLAVYKKATNAEWLFQIIQNLNPEAIGEFKGSEIGTDSSGEYVFLDAWGKPIQFIWFAPAFPQSVLQPDIWKISGITPLQANWKDAVNGAKERAKLMYPNPLDPNNLCTGWFIYPLIYSAGPDKSDGLVTDAFADLPEVSFPFNTPNGVPDGTGDHLDNISNHRLSGY